MFYFFLCQYVFLKEGMGLRRLQNTPLGAKLFFGIDKDGSGSIDQNEFVALGKCLIRGSMSDKVESMLLKN